MSSASYYIYQNGKQSGPYSLGNLQAFWREGTVTENSYYWHDGMPDWAPLTDITSDIAGQTEDETQKAPSEDPGYFLFENNTQTGPFTQERLKERYRNSEISDSTFFWREGMESWKPLREISTQLKEPRPQPEPRKEPAYATAGAGTGTGRKSGEQAAIRKIGAGSAASRETAPATAQAAGGNAAAGTVNPEDMDEGEIAVLEGPFREIVRKDAEMFGEGPISPHDSEGPFYEVKPDGKTTIRMSLTELRHAYQSGHFGPDLALRSEGDPSWGRLADLQEQLN